MKNKKIKIVLIILLSLIILVYEAFYIYNLDYNIAKAMRQEEEYLSKRVIINKKCGGDTLWGAIKRFTNW